MLEEKILPEHFYWAQIAAEIRRSWIKHPDKVDMKDFLKPYKKVKVEPKKKRKILDMKAHTKAAKEFFFGALGLPLEDK